MPHWVRSSRRSAAYGWNPRSFPLPRSARRDSLPEIFRNTIMDNIETRVAQGLSLDEMNGVSGGPNSALWARVPGHLTPSAATLAIFGDYVSGGASQALGRRSMGDAASTTRCGWRSSDRRNGCCATSESRADRRLRPGSGLPVVTRWAAVGHGEPILCPSASGPVKPGSRSEGLHGRGVASNLPSGAIAQSVRAQH